MNATQVLKLTIMGVAITFAAHWLKGHDVLTAVALIGSLSLSRPPTRSGIKR